MKGRFLIFALLALLVLAVAAQDGTATKASASVVNSGTKATDTPSLSADNNSQSDSNSGSDEQSPSQAGADGPDAGSFKLSKGGMVAIIIVVCVVAVGGIVSTTLFFIAKKRQWEVRKSLKRVSRRLTGRGGKDNTPSNRENRRTAVRMASPPPGKNRANKERDLEKGVKKPAASSSRRDKPTMSAFSVETPVVKSWKDKVFGYKA